MTTPNYHYPARAVDTEPICPERIYTLAAFHRTTGISKTRVREARRLGLPLPLFAIGKRKFVRGAAAIEWMERLSVKLAETAAKAAAAKASK